MSKSVVPTEPWSTKIVRPAVAASMLYASHSFIIVLRQWRATANDVVSALVGP